MVILFPHLRLDTYIQRDIEILRAEHIVMLEPSWPVGRLFHTMLAVRKVDCVWLWFGSVRFLPIALVARLLGIPVVVIAGGYDVAAVPSLRYGNMYRPISRFLGRVLFKCSKQTICVSHSCAREAVGNAGVPEGRVRVIHHGFDDGCAATSVSEVPKERIVLSVGWINEASVWRKGFVQVMRVAALMPDVPFVIAGQIDPRALTILEKHEAPNVTFTGHLAETALSKLYARALVYLQPSLHEGFGCAVAEAMLHNCVPIVTRQFALPEVVGNCGFYVEPYDYDGIAEAVRNVVDRSIFPEGAPRERVLSEFPLQKRRESLLHALNEVCAD